MEPWEEEGPEVVKRFMYVNRRAPYGTIYALECLEVVLIAAAFDQDVSVVFVDDGVYQLKKSQDTNAIGMKNCKVLQCTMARMCLMHLIF